jgi:hypothetical protein
MKQHKKGLKVRDGLAAGMIVAGLMFSLACTSDDDTNNGNNGSNNGSNNGGNGSNITVSGTIEGETTWKGTVTLKGSVEVTGGTLTIEPGTTIIMCATCTLDIGWNNSATALVAQGTADKPITIKGATAGKGFWGKVLVGSSVASTGMSHVIIDGAGNGEALASLEVSSSIGLTDVVVRNGAAAGVMLYKVKAGGTIAVEQVDGHVGIISDQSVQNMPAFTSTGAGKNSIYIKGNDWSADEIVLKDQGIPYYINDDVDQTNGSVIIEAGTKFEMAAGSSLEFGWNSSATSVQMNGTAEKPISFEGVVDEAGSWDGITIGSKVNSNSKLSHVELTHGGSDDYGALYVGSKVLLEDVTLRKSLSYGLDVSSEGLKAGSARVSAHDTKGYPVRINGGALLDMPADGTFTNNTESYVLVQGNEFNGQQGTLRALEIPYYLSETLQLDKGANWTIEAGSKLVFGPDKFLEVGWNSDVATLKVEGSEGKPVTFESKDGSDTLWGGIHIEGQVTSDSAIRYATIRHTGAEGTPAIRLKKKISIEKSVIEGTKGNGIELLGSTQDDETYLNDLSSNNSFSDIGKKNVCGEAFPGDMFLCD